MEIKVNIDIDRIVKEVLEEDGGNWTIKERVRDEIRERIIAQIKEQLDIPKVKEKGFTKDFLTKTAQEIVRKELREVTEEFCKKWIKDNMKAVLISTLNETVEAFLLPLVQQVVSKVIVINKDEIEAIVKDYEEQLKEAYKDGMADATEEIRRSI